MTHNSENERIKNDYLFHMSEADGLADSTTTQRLYAIALFEDSIGHKSFKNVRNTDAIGYRKHLLARSGKRQGELSSRSAVDTNLKHVQKFFRWLATRPGYVRALRALDTDYFSLSRRDRKIAETRSAKYGPPIESVKALIKAMPSATAIEKRDRAMVALLLLTGVRVKALSTLKLKHVRPDGLGIDQDAREVATKFGKTFTTFFFPMGDEIKVVFREYVEFLRRDLTFGEGDPLFPSTRTTSGDDRQLAADGLTKAHWRTAEPVTYILKKACRGAGMAYFTPHTIRKSLATMGEQLCRTPEEFKAWSQNIGHDDVLTTFRHYGAVPAARQQALVSGAGAGPIGLNVSTADLLAEFARRSTT